MTTVKQHRLPIIKERRLKEMARHKQEIMETALNLFSQKGYHNVSMQEISREAQFGLGTIYKFFKNKEGLYRSIVLEKARECHMELKRALYGSGDLEERLLAYIEAKLSFLRDNTPFARLYLFETQGSRFSIRAGMEEEIKKLHDEIISLLAGLFQEGVEKGLIRQELQPRTLAVALEGMSNGVIVDWLENGGEKPGPSASSILSLFLDQVFWRSKNIVSPPLEV